jgi:ABC-type uncharacterized transport system permease subunit
MLLTVLNITTAVIYLMAAVAAWVGMGRAQTTEYADAADGTNPAGLAKILIWLGIMLHGVALFDAMFIEEGWNIGFSHTTSLIGWLTLLSYVVLGNDSRLTRLAALYLAPLAIVAALLPTLLPSDRVMLYGGWAFRLHIGVAIAGYALFTVAALHALLMLFLEKRLQSGTLNSFDNQLPPLMQVEKLLFRLLFAAFILLTFTLISGVFFSEAVYGKAFQVNYKTVFAAMSWLIFGGLLLGHVRFGWRGKTAVRWTLIGFVMLLLAYVGSKFVLEFILKRL